VYSLQTRQWSLATENSPHTLTDILTLYVHLYLGLPSDLFFRVAAYNFHAFLISSKPSSEAQSVQIFTAQSSPTFLSCNSSKVKIFSSVPCFQISSIYVLGLNREVNFHTHKESQNSIYPVISPSKMAVFCVVAPCRLLYIDSLICTHRRENLKSYLIPFRSQVKFYNSDNRWLRKKIWLILYSVWFRSNLYVCLRQAISRHFLCYRRSKTIPLPSVSLAVTSDERQLM
jgi:hypothetical protein